MFMEQEKREILDNSLPWNYRNELTSKEWNIYKEPSQRTVDRLEVEAAEPAVKVAAATAKSIADLKQDSNGGSSTCKRNHNGKEKVTGEKKQCTHCGKKHAGVC